MTEEVVYQYRTRISKKGYKGDWCVWAECSIEYYYFYKENPFPSANCLEYQVRKIYIEQPQAKPVPLTEEQINEIWDKNCLKRRTNDLDYSRNELMDAYSFYSAVREVEAAHGITKEPSNG